MLNTIQCALIVGASSGVGLACVRHLHKTKKLRIFSGELPRVWHVDSQSQLLGEGGASKDNEYLSRSRGRSIRDVCMSMDGQQLIQRFDGYPRTQLYRVTDGQLTLETDIQNGVAAPTALSAKSNRFLLGNSDTRARVWDSTTGKPAGPFLQHPSFIRLGSLSPDGNLAATFAADGRLRIWNATRGDLILSGEFSPQQVRFAFGADSRRLFLSRQGVVLGELAIPRWEGTLDMLRRLIELHSCEQIDQTQGIADLDIEYFQLNREKSIEAWQASLALYQ